MNNLEVKAFTKLPHCFVMTPFSATKLRTIWHSIMSKLWIWNKKHKDSQVKKKKKKIKRQNVDNIEKCVNAKIEGFEYNTKFIYEDWEFNLCS